MDHGEMDDTPFQDFHKNHSQDHSYLYSLTSSAYFSLYSIREALLMVKELFVYLSTTTRTGEREEEIRRNLAWKQQQGCRLRTGREVGQRKARLAGCDTRASKQRRALLLKPHIFHIYDKYRSHLFVAGIACRLLASPQKKTTLW